MLIRLRPRIRAKFMCHLPVSHLKSLPTLTIPGDNGDGVDDGDVIGADGYDDGDNKLIAIVVIVMVDYCVGDGADDGDSDLVIIAKLSL